MAVAGADYSFHCTATGFPLPSISWYLNNSEVSSGNGTTITNSNSNGYTVYSTLSITRTDLHHAGTYMCIARNIDRLGQVQEDRSNATAVEFTCKLEILLRNYLILYVRIVAPPQLTEAPQTYALFDILNVTFTCEFQSLPEADVTWTKGNSNPLSSSENYAITTETVMGENYIYKVSNLTVLNANSKDQGEYICNASNSVNNLIDATSTGIGVIFVQGTNSKSFLTICSCIMELLFECTLTTFFCFYLFQ